MTIFGLGKKETPASVELTSPVAPVALSKEQQIEVVKQQIFGGATGENNQKGELSLAGKAALVVGCVTVVPAIIYAIVRGVQSFKASRADADAGLKNLSQEGVKELHRAVTDAVRVINSRSTLVTERPANYAGGTLLKDNAALNADLELHNQCPEALSKLANLASARLERTLGLSVSSEIVEAAILKKISEVKVSNKDGFTTRLQTEFSKFSAMLYNRTIERAASKDLKDINPIELRDLLLSIKKSRNFSDVQMAGVAQQFRTEFQRTHTPEQVNALIAKYNNEETFRVSDEFKAHSSALQASRTAAANSAKAKLERLAGQPGKFDGSVDAAYKAYIKAETELHEARVKFFANVVGMSGLNGQPDQAVAAASVDANAQANHTAFKSKLDAKERALKTLQDVTAELNTLNGGDLFFAVCNASDEKVNDDTMWHFRQKKDLLQALSVNVDSNDLHAMGAAYDALRNFLNHVATRNS